MKSDFNFHTNDLIIYVNNLKDKKEVKEEIERRCVELTTLMSNLVINEARTYIGYLQRKDIDLTFPLEYLSSLNVKVRIYSQGENLTFDPEVLIFNHQEFIIKKKTFFFKISFLNKINNLNKYNVSYNFDEKNNFIVEMEGENPKIVTLKNFKKIKHNKK